MIEVVTHDRSGATFSACGRYRYHLWRAWSSDPARSLFDNAPDRGTCLFIMLNPSTADAIDNDPTVERCERRAVAWGFTRLEVCNIFALRSTDPKALYSHADPEGPENRRRILAAARGAGLVVCAWGAHGRFRDQGIEIAKMLARDSIALHALKVNSDGTPAHPLYLPYLLEPTQWQP